MIPLSLCSVPAGAPKGLQQDHQAAVERYSRYLEARHLSPHTRRLYLGSVVRWFEQGGVPGHLDTLKLMRWLALRRATVAVNTVNLDLKALRSFYRLQESFGACAPGCAAAVPAGRKPPKRLPRYLTAAEVGEVLGSLPLDTFRGLRDYALLRVLFEAGLRASELVDLQLGSITSDRCLFVQGGKGRVDRYVPISAELAGVLEGYIHARAGTKPGKRNALWVKGNGLPLRNGRSVWEIVSRHLWRVLGQRGGGVHKLRGGGTPWRGHYPHTLRASFATALLHNGCPITAIAQMMGHRDTATTALYLGVDLAQLRAAVTKHPRALRVSE